MSEWRCDAVQKETSQGFHFSIRILLIRTEFNKLKRNLYQQ